MIVIQSITLPAGRLIGGGGINLGDKAWSRNQRGEENFVVHQILSGTRSYRDSHRIKEIRLIVMPVSGLAYDDMSSQSERRTTAEIHLYDPFLCQELGSPLHS